MIFKERLPWPSRKFLKEERERGRREGRRKEGRKKLSLCFFPIPLERITEGRHIDKICHSLWTVESFCFCVGWVDQCCGKTRWCFSTYLKRNTLLRLAFLSRPGSAWTSVIHLRELWWCSLIIRVVGKTTLQGTDIIDLYVSGSQLSKWFFNNHDISEVFLMAEIRDFPLWAFWSNVFICMKTHQAYPDIICLQHGLHLPWIGAKWIFQKKSM